MGKMHTIGDAADGSGTCDTSRNRPPDDPEAVLLVDRWRDQAALDAHHAPPMMGRIAELREKHDLHMRVERFADLDGDDGDREFIRE